MPPPSAGQPSSDPPQDPLDLSEFPDIEIRDVLWRTHQAAKEPVWFCICRACRFDPPPHRTTGFGTCHTAVEPIGAYIEKFARRQVLTEDFVDKHVISELHLRRTLRLADLTATTIGGKYGVFGDVTMGVDYELSQEWAGALQGAGFDGIYYPARHDTSAGLRSVAVFGSPGAHPDELYEHKVTRPISYELQMSAFRSFGIQVWPKTPIA